MKFDNKKLSGLNSSSLSTEILFEVASARASGIELLRLDVTSDDEKTEKKLFSAALRVIRGMKARGAIQFYATSEAFAGSTTEAKFLLNKYPELKGEFESSEQGSSVIYVRI